MPANYPVHPAEQEAFIDEFGPHGPVYSLFVVRLFNRQAHRRPNWLLAVVVAAMYWPMFAMDLFFHSEELALISYAFAPIGVAAMSMTSARRLSENGALFHFLATPLTVTDVLADLREYYARLGRIAFRCWAVCVIAGWAMMESSGLFLNPVGWFSTLVTLQLLLFFGWVLSLPINRFAADFGIRLALDGRLFIRMLGRACYFSTLLTLMILGPLVCEVIFMIRSPWSMTPNLVIVLAFWWPWAALLKIVSDRLSKPWEDLSRMRFEARVLDKILSLGHA